MSTDAAERARIRVALAQLYVLMETCPRQGLEFMLAHMPDDARQDLERNVLDFIRDKIAEHGVLP